MDILTQNFPMLAGMGAILTLGWNYIKQAIFYLRSTLVRTVSIDTSNSCIPGESIHLKLRGYFKYIFKFDDVVQLRFRYLGGMRIPYTISVPSFYIAITHGNFPVLVKEGLRDGPDYTPTSITFVRGTLDINKILQYIDNYTLQIEKECEPEGRFQIVEKYGRLNDKMHVGSDSKVLSTQKHQDIVAINVLLNIDHGFLITGKERLERAHVQHTIDSQIDFGVYDEDVTYKVKTLKHWVENKQWFNDRDIPWNRSIRVEGVPGSGKSTFIVNLAKYLNLPIYKLHLSTMDSQDFLEAWKDIAKQSPAIILLEDFDRLFNEDKSFKLDQITLDTILNAISGANEYNGVLTIMTANFPERLDDALGKIVDGVSTRPGRLDFLIEINELNERGRRAIANKILDKYPNEIDTIVKQGEGETASQFSQRCIELAQLLFFQEFDTLCNKKEEGK